MKNNDLEVNNKQSTPLLIRVLPMLLLALGLVLFFFFDLDAYLTLDALKENRQLLKNEVEDLGYLAPLLYALLYCIVTAFSIPGGLILSVTSGFLFGIYFGTLSVVVGATLGAVLVFLAVRFGIGDALVKKAGKTIQKMEAGFRENAFNSLLVLRLVPLFPFWLVNIVPAIFRMPVGSYALATFFGIAPGSFVYVLVGNGINAIFDSGQDPDLTAIATKPEVILPIVGLAILSMIPIVYKYIKQRKSHGE